MDNEIEEFAKYIKLEEQIKLNFNANEEDDDDEVQTKIVPFDSTSAITSAASDVFKRGRSTLSAPKATKSTLEPKAPRFVGSESNPVSMAAYMGKNISMGGAATPMTRMPIAASYEPFKGIDNTVLNENLQKMKRRVNSLLNREPHKTVVNQMKKELEM